MSLKLTDPRIEIPKSQRLLRLFDGEELVRAFPVVLGFSPVGGKQLEGDGKTPEGEFYVCAKNPKSKYYRSLCISYPSPEDALRGLENGLIGTDEHDQILDAWSKGAMPPQKTPLGGEIYIHGHGSETEATRGCVALKDSDMKELFESTRIGTPVVILP